MAEISLLEDVLCVAVITTDNCLSQDCLFCEKKIQTCSHEMNFAKFV